MIILRRMILLDLLWVHETANLLKQEADTTQGARGADKASVVCRLRCTKAVKRHLEQEASFKKNPGRFSQLTNHNYQHFVFTKSLWSTDLKEFYSETDFSWNTHWELDHLRKTQGKWTFPNSIILCFLVYIIFLKSKTGLKESGDEWWWQWPHEHQASPVQPRGRHCTKHSMRSAPVLLPGLRCRGTKPQCGEATRPRPGLADSKRTCAPRPQLLHFYI